MHQVRLVFWHRFGGDESKVANSGNDLPGVTAGFSMLYNVPAYSDYSPLPSYNEVRDSDDLPLF